MLIYSWKEHSNGAKELASALGIKRIRHENSKFVGVSYKKVLNWGASSVPDEVKKCTIINQPSLVEECTNKLSFFKKLSNLSEDLSFPEWTDSFDIALDWLGHGDTVCARKVLKGHSANGLVLMTSSEPSGFVKAPLYTKYVPKKEEYRVHILNGKVIDVQRKAKKSDFEGEVNWKIRNLDNGFIYAREGFTTPQCVLDQAELVVAEIKLDFGAVDIIWQKVSNKAFILEINTAPGLEGTTVIKYAEAIKESYL